MRWRSRGVGKRRRKRVRGGTVEEREENAPSWGEMKDGRKKVGEEREKTEKNLAVAQDNT